MQKVICSYRSGALTAGLLLPVLIVAAYWQAPENGFHFDDRYSITEHAPVRIKELTPANLLQAATDAHHPNRPLPSVLFAIDWWRGGGDPAAFQVTNLLIHVANALVVLALLRLIFRYRTGAGGGLILTVSVFSAALWALHPIQVQAVTYIVQRMASLAALFMLLSVWSYLKARFADRMLLCAVYSSLAILTCLLGALSKENAWITPVLWILAEYGVVRHDRDLPGRRTNLAVLGLPMLLAAFCLAGLLSRSGFVHEFVSASYAGRDFTLEQRLLTQPRVIFFHLSQVLWPLPDRFSMEHDFIVSTSLVSPWTTVVALGGIVIWLGLAGILLIKKHHRLIGFFLVWMPVTIAVESSFIGLEMVFEHRMYLPSFGLAGLLAAGLMALAKRRQRLLPVAVAGLALAGAGLFSVTAERLPVWRDELSLLQHSLRHAPGKARVWSNLASHYINTGRQDLAEAPARRALQLDPDNASALGSLAVVLTGRGRLGRAENLLLQAYELGEADHSWLVNMGVLMLVKGDGGIEPERSYRMALDYFQQAGDLQPWSLDYLRNIAIANGRLGRCSEARRQWSQYFESESDPARRAKALVFRRREFESPQGHCRSGQ